MVYLFLLLPSFPCALRMQNVVRGTAERQSGVKHTHGRAAHPILRKEIARDFCLPDAFPRNSFSQ